MTLRIPIPLGFIRALLLLAVAWGGAAGIALSFSYWLDDEGVTNDDLKAELANYATDDDLKAELADYATDDDVEAKLADYATVSDLASIRSQLAALRGGTSSTGLESAVAVLLIGAAATGELSATAVKEIYFPAASSADYDTCVDSYAGRTTQEATARETCLRVFRSIDFGPEQ